MSPAEQPETLEKSLKDLNLSTDEMTKFEKAFKDPEFLRLFEEYAKEVSDPKVKAETDAYLRQIEDQGRAEDVYGKGAQLVVPDPAGAVMKTKVVAGSTPQPPKPPKPAQEVGGKEGGKPEAASLPAGRKVFINICTSDKLERYSLDDAHDPASGRMRPKLSVPLTLGPARQGVDKHGQAAAVYDFVVHPDSWAYAASSAAALATVVETALEHVEQVSRARLSRKWKRLNCRYKGTEGAMEPPVQCIRIAAPEGGAGASEAVGGRVRPRPDVPGVDVPGAQTAPSTSAEGEGGNAAPRSTFSFDKSGGRAKLQKQHQPAQLQAQKPAVKDPLQPGFRHPDGAVTPQWELVHRGEADLAEAWGDAGRGLAAGAGVPKELLVRVTLPDVSSAAAVDLDVGERRLTLKVPGRYRLDVPLPHRVDDTQGRAKLDKGRQQLVVTLPVLPPPPPPARPAGAAQALIQLLEEVEAGPMQQGGQEREEGQAVAVGGEAADIARDQNQEAVVAGPSGGVQAVGTKGAEKAELVAEVSPSEEAVTSSRGTAGPKGKALGAQQEQEGQGRELTENERRWHELHAKQHAAEEEQRAVATATAAAVAASAAKTAGAAAPVAADAATAAAAATVVEVVREEAAPTMMLRPRLRRDLAMELD